MLIVFDVFYVLLKLLWQSSSTRKMTSLKVTGVQFCGWCSNMEICSILKPTALHCAWQSGNVAMRGQSRYWTDWVLLRQYPISKYFNQIWIDTSAYIRAKFYIFVDIETFLMLIIFTRPTVYWLDWVDILCNTLLYNLIIVIIITTTSCVKMLSQV